MKLDAMKDYAPSVLRYSMALVFFWFGISQVTDPVSWTIWLPKEIALVPLAPETIIVLNGIAEIVGASLLIAGLFTRIIALLLGLHLLGIVFAVGYNAIGVRDFGLAIATMVIFMNGPDKLCLDNKIWKKKQPVS